MHIVCSPSIPNTGHNFLCVFIASSPYLHSSQLLQVQATDSWFVKLWVNTYAILTLSLPFAFVLHSAKNILSKGHTCSMPSICESVASKVHATTPAFCYQIVIIHITLTPKKNITNRNSVYQPPALLPSGFRLSFQHINRDPSFRCKLKQMFSICTQEFRSSGENYSTLFQFFPSFRCYICSVHIPCSL